MGQIVHLFQYPTIGYCKKCDVLAIWSDEKGLHCPKCLTTEVSIFIWDEDSPSPE